MIWLAPLRVFQQMRLKGMRAENRPLFVAAMGHAVSEEANSIDGFQFDRFFDKDFIRHDAEQEAAGRKSSQAFDERNTRGEMDGRRCVNRTVASFD